MKKGDQVKIKDGSYMLTPTINGLTDQGKYPSTKVIGWCADTFTVIATDGRYPAKDGYSKHNDRVNSTMIMNNENGELWFCSALNIMPVLPKHTMGELFKIVGYKFEII